MKFGLLNVGLFLLLSISIEAKLRSYGGKYARKGQFPFAAILSYNGRSGCGASIIHERWALTAAHCLHSYLAKPQLTVGTTVNLIPSKTYDIEKLFVHRDFVVIPENINNGLEYVVNDIGLLRLASKITFDERTKPIALARDAENTYENATANAVGWGIDKHGQVGMHKNLRYTSVRVLTPQECRKVWTYADKHMCTSTQEHQGVCNGDSGSPLVVNGVQVGIVSTGDTYCESIKPDLYTKVASFIPWIEKVLKQYGDVLPVA